MDLSDRYGPYRPALEDRPNSQLSLIDAGTS